MPFMLYDVSGEPGKEQYAFVREVSLAGRSHPLALHSRGANPQGHEPFGWHAAEGDLIRRLDGATPDQAIIIDLKPRVAGNVSLFRLLDVWGFSYSNWTPLALRLRTLFADHGAPNPHTFKDRFVDPGTDHRLVGELLYVQGGVSKGKWTWGQVGRVNGALLWREAFEFLVPALSQAMQAAPS
ncbi:MAG TPA: hypothetical protein VH120_04300 [Gemmataceae bacterium]|jgi:hypothetical protein|nr:hypothetical protein [Gemmataceae bacterium]